MIDNVTSILDIEGITIQNKLYDLLKSHETFRDQVLEEHLYNSSVWEDIGDMEIDVEESLIAKLKEIEKLCEDAECSYFRFINY